MGVGLLAMLATGACARASTVSFVLVPQDPNAVADDSPALADRVTTDLKVTVPTGFDWSNAAIEIVLSQGSVYNATNAAGTESSPNTALWSIPTLRNGAFDTFVNSKNFASATILGSFSNGTDGPPPAQGLSTNNATAVRVSWGNTTLGEDGTFTVGRFTLSSNAVGTFNGRSFATDAPGTPINFTGSVANGALSVPEPTTGLILVALAPLLPLRRRRTTARSL
jgi:hypothetical protein